MPPYLIATCRGCRTLSDYLAHAAWVLVVGFVLLLAWWWYSRRRSTRSKPPRSSRMSPTRQLRKPISAATAANGFSLIVERLAARGYSASSPDDPDLNAEASSLAELDDRVRHSIRERLGAAKGGVDVRLGYVWQDFGPAPPGAGADMSAGGSGKPPRQIYLDVRESPGNGFVAEGDPGVRVTAPTLDGLALEARTEIARRWPAPAGKQPGVTFGWVRTVRI